MKDSTIFKMAEELRNCLWLMWSHFNQIFGNEAWHVHDCWHRSRKKAAPLWLLNRLNVQKLA